MEDVALAAGECILKLLWETVKRLKDLPDDVREIRDELDKLKNFIDLEDKEADGENDGTKRNKKKQDLMQLRKATFLTEDVIDEYLIRIEEKQPQDDRGWAAFHIQTLIPRFKISFKIESNLSVVRRTNERFRNNRPQSTQNNNNVTFHQCRMDPLFMEEQEVVGLAGPTEILKDWLKNGQRERTVIFVVGVPGVGKTTLAKHVFNKVCGDFEHHARFTVSQSNTVEELWRVMYKHYMKSEPPSDNSILIEEVRGYLRGKRYVLLFDDVWEDEFWKSIEKALIDNKNKSRIIITTRKENVANSCRNSPFFKEYKLEEPLTEEECLRLLHKNARYSSDCPEELKDISLEIVRKCRALPLAIAVAGGVLKEKDGSAHEWGLFSEELKRNPDLNIITKIVGLSYDNLPSHLRLCLLYFGMYPKDYEIKYGRLVRQWVAEGFVTDEGRKTLEEVAHGYLLYLVERSLVQVTSYPRKEKVKKCRVTDSIHDMILTKVKDTCFGEYIGGGHDQSESSDLVRRLTIETNNDLNRRFKRSHIRSIISIPGKQEESWSVDLERNILKDDMPLKVLDFEGCGLFCVPKKLGNLIYLRYLSFRGTQITVLPKSIGKLVNLKTLDIRQTQVLVLPKEITKLRKLRHLLTPSSAFSSIEWKDIGGMTMLQKIPQVRMEDDGEAIKEVGKLKQLRNLRVLCFGGEHITLLFSSINEMEHLQALRIEKSGDRSVVDLNTTLPRFPWSKLRKLFLDMKLERLPNWIPQLKNLERLTLRHSDLTNDPLESLKDMPCLLVLSLSHAYEGQTLHFQPGGFKKLRMLNLQHLWNLNSILIAETALQALEDFELTCLDDLRTVPDGIQHLMKLKSVRVPYMPTQFVEEIVRIGKDKPWRINYGYM
ncbi:disease resistance protein RPM1-like isoform X1 [Vigna radiata var. radiata]|uniref:Disease resistance protein RPM1-like isoform X1 n=1 Tax=Vigna radiata var. radiata TaxID=3916 RepID=A0A1S3VIC4_VIGRR|nr:disease resistance protein RPM1-like isoform X1 [Vigna radiata var. radiata]